MKASPRFALLPLAFWAYVRALSQHLGYTREGKLLEISAVEIRRALRELKLELRPLNKKFRGKPLVSHLTNYFRYRAQTLQRHVEPRLMDRAAARKEFLALKKQLRPCCPLPKNKQKGRKRGHAFLSGIVNMLIEANTSGCACNYNPLELATVTRDGTLLCTLSRRLDGAFPSCINPIAIWEVKEYYNTTTFGSRVADGVYESLLDGMELTQLAENADVRVLHYLFVDDHYTWWECGKSYLCRLIDMLNMGYVDEILFGREVLERLPTVARSWKRHATRQRLPASHP